MVKLHLLIVLVLLICTFKVYNSQDIEISLLNTNITQTLDDLLDQGKSANALEIITNLTNEEQNNTIIKLKYARALIQTGKFTQGESILNNIYSDTPDNIEANLLLSKYHIRNKNWNKAETHLNHAISLTTNANDTNNHAKALALLSTLVSQRDNNNIYARELIEKAILIQPNNPQLQFDCGILRFYSNTTTDHILAKQAFDEAVRLNPNLDNTMIGKSCLYTNTYYDMAYCYMRI